MGTLRCPLTDSADPFLGDGGHFVHVQVLHTRQEKPLLCSFCRLKSSVVSNSISWVLPCGQITWSQRLWTMQEQMQEQKAYEQVLSHSLSASLAAVFLRISWQSRSC